MSVIKLVLADLDGTIALPGSHEVSEKVIASVKAAEAKGVVVCAVTGRYYDLAKNLLMLLGFKDLCVFDGGAVIANPVTGEVVWSRSLTIPQIKQVLEIVVPYCSVVSLGPGRDIAIEPGRFNISGVTQPATHFWGSVPIEKGAKLVAQINTDPALIAHSNPGPNGDFTRSGIHVTRRQADKFHGVQQLLKLNGVAPNNVLAIGDGDNDLPLFQSAGFKVAMGNATESLKSKADAIVGTVYEDGFAEAINKFVLSGKN